MNEIQQLQKYDPATGQNKDIFPVVKASSIIGLALIGFNVSNNTIILRDDNGNVRVYQLTPYSPGQEEIIYGPVNVSLNYQLHDFSAGTIAPILSCTQVKTTINAGGTFVETITPTLESKVFSISGNPSDVSINPSTGVISFGENNTHNSRSLGTVSVSVSANDQTGSAIKQVTQKGIETTDYFIGWFADGSNSSFAAFAALNPTQLVAISSPYVKNTQQSVTKNITSSDIIGTRQIFFIMWREESTPQGGVFYGGLSAETLSAQSFLDSNVFNAQRDSVIIDGTTYQVAGMRMPFEPGNYFTINF